MKYFTGELWRNINAEDKVVREHANLEWEKRDALYSKIYDKEKKRFPVEFIRLLENDGGLHDYKINKLSMIMEDWLNRSCVVAVSDGEKEYELVFHGVTSFAVNFPILSNRKWDDMWWGYEEIGHKGRSLYGIIGASKEKGDIDAPRRRKAIQLSQHALQQDSRGSSAKGD